MIVGTEVTSDDCPGATGIVTIRQDTDSEVLMLVSWVTATGQTCLTWHRESALAVTAPVTIQGA